MARNEKLEQALDAIAVQLTQLASDAVASDPTGVLNALALQRAGLTAQQLRYMGEHDDNNPKYTLYYAELSLMAMKALGRAVDRMSN